MELTPLLNSKDSLLETTTSTDNLNAENSVVDTSYVYQEDLANESIGANQLQGSIIAGTHVTAEAVDSRHIAGSAVDGTHVADSAIDSINIAGSAVDGTHITDRAIDSIHITGSAVDGTHIADAAIVSANLGTEIIDSAQIIGSAVDGTHISDGAIVALNIGGSVIAGTHIADGAITATQIGTFDFSEGSGTIVSASLDVGTTTAITQILDEDDMSSDSAVALATQQSIKAYVDTNAGGDILGVQVFS